MGLSDSSISFLSADEYLSNAVQSLHLSAYSPLGSPDSAADMGNEDKQKPLDDPVVKEIAKKYNKSAGQVSCIVLSLASKICIWKSSVKSFNLEMSKLLLNFPSNMKIQVLG